MGEYIACPDCLTIRMKADKLVEHRRTLQLVCPKCGRLEFVPVWGARVLRPIVKRPDNDEVMLRRLELQGTLRSVPHRRKNRG